MSGTSSQLFLASSSTHFYVWFRVAFDFALTPEPRFSFFSEYFIYIIIVCCVSLVTTFVIFFFIFYINCRRKKFSLSLIDFCTFLIARDEISALFATRTTHSVAAHGYCIGIEWLFACTMARNLNEFAKLSCKERENEKIITMAN